MPLFRKKDDYKVKKDTAIAFQALLGTDSQEGKKKIIKDNRRLLFSDTAHHIIQLSIEDNVDNPDLVQTLLEYRDILARCQSKGIDKAFEERIDIPVEIVQAIESLVSAGSVDEQKRIVVANRGLLLNRAAIKYLVFLTTEHAGDSESIQKIIGLGGLLRRCRKDGIEAAFAQQAGHKEIDPDTKIVFG